MPVITSTLPGRPSHEVFELSMLAMISLGVGEIIGSIFMGIVVDAIGSKKACFINLFFVSLQTGCVILYLYLNEYSWLAFAMTFLWGV